jgi:two-component system sensor kinase FixL
MRGESAAAQQLARRAGRLSRRLLQAPLAFVSLLDQSRNLLLGPDEIPQAICRALRELDLPLAIRDARIDPRVSGSPGVTDFGIVAYLAVPLKPQPPDGPAIGSLCVADRVPRDWTGEDERALSDLAEMVMAALATSRPLHAPTAAKARTDEARPGELPPITRQMVWFTDLAGRATYVNQHYAEFTGLSSEQSRGDGWLAIVHPQDRERVLSTWKKAVADKTDYETEMRVRRVSDGSFRWILSRASPLRGPDGRVERWIGVGVDIDDRKRAEETVHALIEALGVAVYTTDAEGRLTFYNESAVRLWGWRPALGDIRWCGSWRLYSPDGRPMPHDACPMSVALRESRAVRGEEVVAERPDATRVPFMAYPTPLFDVSGTLVGGVNVLVDITERTAVEAALTESEARLRSILDTVPDAIVAIDEQGLVESFSATAEQMFGYEAPDLLGRAVSMLVPSLEGEQQGLFLATSAERGGRTSGGGRVLKGLRKDGSVFPLEIALGEVRFGARQVFTGFLRDLTEQQATDARLEELRTELLHVSRFSAAGEMASALAHELNQPLTAVASAVRAAERMLASSPDADMQQEIRLAIDLAAKQAVRGGQIVHRLRDFVTREGEADKRVEDLPKLVEEASALAFVGVRERGIDVSFRYGSCLPAVLVDRTQIQQVLFNLMRNAIEAMTHDDRADPPRPELSVAVATRAAEMVEVAVADNGPGLAPELSGRLFQSFVSTKQDGMGMGLSICRSIVESHGGRIWADPAPCTGAVFRFTLPAAPPDPPV